MNSKYQLSDWRSLDFHKLIAEKIRANPSLVQKALSNMKRWEEQNGCHETLWDDWLVIIESGLEPLIDFMTSESDEAQRLRSSSPFVGILTQEERNEIRKKYHNPV